MYIFFYVSIIVFIIGIIFFIIGLRKQHQDLMVLEDKARDQIRQTCKKLNDECLSLARDRDSLAIQKNSLARERQVEQERLDELKAHTRDVIKSEHERIQTEIGLTRTLERNKLDQEFKEMHDTLEEHFKERQAELEENYKTRAGDIQLELMNCEKKLKEFKDMQEAVNEAILRQKEISEKEFFYSIDVPQPDQEDIGVLQSMDVRMHHRDVIPKLIWELFIRRPTQEMIKRVVGSSKCSGIYKITYKKTGEAYIGKTSDFSTRWQNHVKTAIGLEAAAHATLHTRMAKDGIWNYTFEILEKVDKDHLASREAYYIDLYGTKNQLNMKSGEKNGTQ